MYTGREYDAELKLYYLRARYYSPDLGRFISRDPIDVADDVNLYAYVGNNGVMFVDRRGMAKDLIDLIFSKISSGYNYLVNVNSLDIEELKNSVKYADKVIIVRTVPNDPTNTKPYVPSLHTQIIFYKGDTPIASLGSAPIGGWYLLLDEKSINKYAMYGIMIGEEKNDISGCITGLENSFSTSNWTFNGKLDICWNGAYSCYTNAKY
ncbi:MAG: RHS repeat-associated core domain-containing protein [Candidatus Gracilibacteria bacterium]|nr:RHS repeat-associated core domain-containing protein [Candidatus Gracilibacteria bacterium]